MFSFLIRSEVNDVAVQLKTLADVAAAKYCNVSFETACAAVAADFDERNRHIDMHACTFVYSDLPAFQFYFPKQSTCVVVTLSAIGHGRYAGFMLASHDAGKGWYASVQDGIAYRATGGAKALVKMMEKKFRVRNTNQVLGNL